jgi:exodeoxyribonuclease V alpha subunit
MAKHLSVRLPWHDRGWDGHVCDRPTANVFCTGEYGLKAHGIREGKRDAEEEGRRSQPCATLRAEDYRPPASRQSRHSAGPHRYGINIIRSPS